MVVRKTHRVVGVFFFACLLACLLLLELVRLVAALVPMLLVLLPTIRCRQTILSLAATGREYLAVLVPMLLVLLPTIHCRQATLHWPLQAGSISIWRCWCQCCWCYWPPSVADKQ